MLHDLIIWPKAISFTETILSDLRSMFGIIAVFSIRWDDDKWHDNIRVFYSRSWQRYSSSKLQQAINNKVNHCGCGDFILVIFEDNAPEMAFEQTTDGRSLVNTRVFIKKKAFRSLTGGGHLVHTSNNHVETDRDLTLLLGKSADDFLKAFGNSVSFDHSINRNCTGVDGYDSLTSFFYTLNLSIDYCVLWNYECLTDHCFEQGHDDIDLLVDNLAHIVNLTSAKPISGAFNRVDYNIRIGGQEVPFDFRHIGDNYYDPAWERNLLDNRILERELFYVPGHSDAYFSLLYHAYVHKRQVKPDYLDKLAQLGIEAGSVFNPDEFTVVSQLDAFMKESGYEFIEPLDRSVIYNTSFLSKSTYAFRYGVFIKRTQENGDNGFVYNCRVFKGEDRFIKIGTDWLLSNEAHFLRLLKNETPFPKVKRLTAYGEGAVLEISKLDGVSFADFFSNPTNHSGRFILSFIRQSLDILRLLAQKGIRHRDFTPSNLILHQTNGHCSVGLIDFGWACNYDDSNMKTPLQLGGRFRANNNSSDAYGLCVILMDWWPDLPYVRFLAHILFKESCSRKNQQKILNKARWFSRMPLGLYDEARLFVHRHHRVLEIKNKCLRLLHQNVF